MKAQGNYWPKSIDQIVIEYNTTTGRQRDAVWKQLQPLVVAMASAILERYFSGNFQYLYQGEKEELITDAVTLVATKLKLYNDKYRSYSFVQTIIKNQYISYFTSKTWEVRTTRVEVRENHVIDFGFDDDKIEDLRENAKNILIEKIKMSKSKTELAVLKAYYELVFELVDIPDRFDSILGSIIMRRLLKRDGVDINNLYINQILLKNGMKTFKRKYSEKELFKNVDYSNVDPEKIIQEEEIEAVMNYRMNRKQIIFKGGRKRSTTCNLG